MPHLPPLPAWEAVHPLLIHFPIVLLLVAPLFVVIGAVLSPRFGRPYLYAACLLVLLGTASLFLAASSGEAAAELAQRDASINAVLDLHQRSAFQLRITFSILSAILLAVVVVPVLARPARVRLWSTVLPIVFLVPYAFGVIALVNTAHAGGRLVHQFGVHAMMSPDSAQTPPARAED